MVTSQDVRLMNPPGVYVSGPLPDGLKEKVVRYKKLSKNFFLQGYTVMYAYFHTIYMTLNSKMAISDSQRYPWNRNLINNAENVVAILGSEVHSDNYNIFLEMHKFTTESVPKLWILKSGLCKVLKGTIVNQAMHSLLWGSLEIRLSVPLILLLTVLL